MVINASNTNASISSNLSDEITLPSDKTITASNATGRTLAYDAETGETSGSMNVLSKHMIVQGTSDGSTAPMEFVFEVPDSNRYTFGSGNDGIDISVTANNIYASAKSEKADSVVVAKNEGVYLLGGNAMEYSVSLGLNNSFCDMITLKGQTSNGASLKYSGDDVIASGVSGGATLTVFSNTVDVKEISFKTDSASVLITGDGSGIPGNIDVLVDSNGDGVYDKSLLGNNGNSTKRMYKWWEWLIIIFLFGWIWYK